MPARMISCRSWRSMVASVTASPPGTPSCMLPVWIAGVWTQLWILGDVVLRPQFTPEE